MCVGVAENNVRIKIKQSVRVCAVCLCMWLFFFFVLFVLFQLEHKVFDWIDSIDPIPISRATQ